MKITKIRSTSQGIQGSYANARCHAQPVIPMIEYFEKIIPTFQNFIEWKQGHNVHLLVRKDGLALEFRPFLNNKVWGIEILVRISRGNRVPLVQFTDMSQKGIVTTLLLSLDRPMDKNYHD